MASDYIIVLYFILISYWPIFVPLYQLVTLKIIADLLLVFVSLLSACVVIGLDGSLIETDRSDDNSFQHQRFFCKFVST